MNVTNYQLQNYKYNQCLLSEINPELSEHVRIINTSEDCIMCASDEYDNDFSLHIKIHLSNLKNNYNFLLLMSRIIEECHQIYCQEPKNVDEIDFEELRNLKIQCQDKYDYLVPQRFKYDYRNIREPFHSIPFTEYEDEFVHLNPNYVTFQNLNCCSRHNKYMISGNVNCFFDIEIQGRSENDYYNIFKCFEHCYNEFLHNDII